MGLELQSFSFVEGSAAAFFPDLVDERFDLQKGRDSVEPLANASNGCWNFEKHVGLAPVLFDSLQEASLFLLGHVLFVVADKILNESLVVL